LILSYNNLQGKKTLIIGDVGSGKTRVTRKLLEEAASVEPEIKILDFAPPLKIHDGREVGGHLITRKIPGVIHYKSDNVRTPRISAKTPEELLSLVQVNYEITLRLLMEFMVNPSKVLFINDVSIHLQHGKIDQLLRAVNKANTSILNGYMGDFLSPDLGTGVSEIERSLMEKLGTQMDHLINLTIGELNINE
jgi:hypothetical protein